MPLIPGVKVENRGAKPQITSKVAIYYPNWSLDPKQISLDY